MQTHRTWQTKFSELAGSRLIQFQCFKIKNENIFSLQAKLPSGDPVFVKYFSGENGGKKAENEFNAISKYYNAMPRSLGYTCPRPLDCWTDERLGGHTCWSGSTAVQGTATSSFSCRLRKRGETPFGVPRSGLGFSIRSALQSWLHLGVSWTSERSGMLSRTVSPRTAQRSEGIILKAQKHCPISNIN